MPNNFDTPYDGKHSTSDPTGSDWRTAGWERLVSYGNFAGPGNRNDAQHSAGGRTDYKPIDGMDAAAERHDHGYEALDGHGMFSWEGISRVAGADRRLADETDAEMKANGSRYSDSAQDYSKAMRGIFGGRASAVEGVNWAGSKANEAGQGISNFANSARNWNSVGDAGRGIANGATSGAQWVGNTASQAWNGVSGAANYYGSLGPLGVAGAAFGGGEALLAGGAHLAGQAGRGIANGATSLAQSAGGAIASGAQAVGQGATTAWNGARQVGSTVAGGVSSAAHAAGGALASGASAVGDTARRAGGAIAGGASRAWQWLGG